MEIYLRKQISVPLDKLYPDPNNPRLAIADPPGYEDVDALFDDDIRKQIFQDLGGGTFDVDGLVEAIIGQGWMPIDNIIVWHHPDDGDRYVVVEGNRRRLALERIHTEEMEKARKKLARMQGKRSSYSKKDIADQETLVARLERIVADTELLPVLPIDADSIEDLERKLPRVLAVRHITGAKGWDSWAKDQWLLGRYKQLFADRQGEDVDLAWDAGLIQRVADEASLTAVKTRKQLKSANWFSHFRREWEDDLPDGEEFRDTDYYLFEIIAGKPWIRQQLGIGEDSLTIPEDGENVLFKWVFQHPRTKTGDSNPNVFYRHENIREWERMKRYDDQHGTSFAARFDVENPDDVPTFAEVEADWLAHKARRKPQAVLDELLRRLNDLAAETLANEGRVLRVQLEQLRDQADTFIKMIDAAEG
jgi:hypothetical protein